MAAELPLEDRPQQRHIDRRLLDQQDGLISFGEDAVDELQRRARLLGVLLGIALLIGGGALVTTLLH